MDSSTIQEIITIQAINNEENREIDPTLQQIAESRTTNFKPRPSPEEAGWL